MTIIEKHLLVSATWVMRDHQALSIHYPHYLNNPVSFFHHPSFTDEETEAQRKFKVLGEGPQGLGSSY